MEVKLSIGIEQLLELIRQLTPEQKAEVKSALDGTTSSVGTKDQKLEDLLLNGPTFGEAELAKVNAARESFKKWRISRSF